MFCIKCGKDILDTAVICIHCGSPTPNFNSYNNSNVQPQTQPIIINNSSSSSASAAAAASASGPMRRHHSILFDIFMIFITGGLWIIWMLLRPKYY